ncbi:MAG: oligosaccharide flippase family protein [Betaproteobacteria bacterium]
MKSQSFLRGTAVLVGAGVAAKALGALFAVVVARLIGAEGVGLLQMAFPVFGTATVLCSSGISLATSKLVSERLATGDRRAARQVLYACLVLVAPAGGVPLSFMAFGTLFFCLQQIASGFLNGMGKVYTSVRNGIVGSIVAVTVTFILTGMPGVGIRAPLSASASGSSWRAP